MNPQDFQFTLGAQPSAPDYRDVKAHDLAFAGIYPPSYSEDLSKIPVTMQNKLGICTANLCYYIERLFQKRGIEVRLSRRFLYNVTKHYIDQNPYEGSSMRSAIKAAYKYGVATEATVPTDTTLSHADFISVYEWPKAVWDEALKYRIGGYVSVKTDRDSLASGIAQYGMVYARMEVGKEWYTAPLGNSSWNPKDITPLRKPAQTISGHAVVIYSYDVSGVKMHNILRNSWSEAWANQGNGDFFLEDYAPFLTEAWGITLDPIINDLPKPDDFKYSFDEDMRFGETSEDIKNLQIFLKMKGFFTYPYITGFYGAVTQQAVYKFQLENVIMSWYEKNVLLGSKVGPKTRGVINHMILH